MPSFEGNACPEISSATPGTCFEPQHQPRSCSIEDFQASNSSQLRWKLFRRQETSTRRSFIESSNDAMKRLRDQDCFHQTGVSWGRQDKLYVVKDNHFALSDTASSQGNCDQKDRRVPCSYSFCEDSSSLCCGSSTTCAKPGYGGRLSSYFSSRVLSDSKKGDVSVPLNNLFSPRNRATIIASYTYLGTNRPPRKWRPVNFRTPSFGAVRLTSTSGCKTGTPSSPASPRSTSQPDGMSTDTIGMPARAMSGSATSNGARTGGLKEKPKIASRTTSLTASAVERVFSVSLGSDADAGSVGMSMFVHWVCRRYRAEGEERESHQY